MRKFKIRVFGQLIGLLRAPYSKFFVIFAVFGAKLQILSLFLADNFLKCSPKCLLACMSSGTRRKIQNLGFFWSERGKFWPFLADFGIFLQILEYNFNLIISFG